MVCGGINHLRERWTKRDQRRGDPIVGIAEQLAAQRAARVIAEKCHRALDVSWLSQYDERLKSRGCGERPDRNEARDPQLTCISWFVLRCAR